MPQAYPPPYTPGVQPAGERFNVLSIIGFVLALVGLVVVFVGPVGAVICGHIALSQIKRTGERGRGLAIAALIIGYLSVLLGVAVFALIIVAGVVGAANGVSSNY